jgi:transcriptional regulator with XRE-family HTH domain
LRSGDGLTLIVVRCRNRRFRSVVGATMVRGEWNGVLGMGNRIKAARREREWSQTRLIAELEQVAARRGAALPSRETLKSRISRWENQHAKPDDFYRPLLREAFGLDDRELGFELDAEEPMAAAADELKVRLNAAVEANECLVDALHTQTEAIRLQDRQYGAQILLEQMRSHVANIEEHLSHSVFDSARRPLARVLSDAASLAGWQALDVASIDQAWRFFEIASRAAQQGQDPSMYAFSRMEQAHVVAELTDPATAARMAESVWEETEDQVPAAMRCWMSAATAEMSAEAGETSAAIRRLSLAETTVDALEGDRPPYLVFNATHLNRWVGHTLAVMGDAAAEERLRHAEAGMDGSFTRARASLNLDLATALRKRGEYEEAGQRLSQAERLAKQVASRRQLARVRQLRAAS